MSDNRCDGTAGSGMVYAIRKNAPFLGRDRQTIIVFKGCSFSCAWCQNPELRSYAPELRLHAGRCVRCGACVETCSTEAALEITNQGASNSISIDREVCVVCGACISGCRGHAREIIGQCMTAEEVIHQVAPVKTGDRITFSGGEPLMQVGFLQTLLMACKQFGMHTTVDTSGYTPWEFFDRVRSLVDLFYFDIKLMDEERHRTFTGLPNTRILENLQKLSQLGHRIVLRVPLIPGISDDQENLLKLLEFASHLPHLEGVILIPYHPAEKERFEALGLPYHPVSSEAIDSHLLQDVIRRFAAIGVTASIVDTISIDQSE